MSDEQPTVEPVESTGEVHEVQPEGDVLESILGREPKASEVPEGEVAPPAPDPQEAENAKVNELKAAGKCVNCGSEMKDNECVSCGYRSDL